MLIIGLFDFGSARLVNALHISKTAETTQAAANAAETVADSGETAPEADAENSGETAPEADAENSGETALRETSAPVNNEGN